ncbi:hypothetical protein NNC19_21920 [Clostridium sp. SHJSY1]|uniref:hypothetical protein n=1 Tax=Clostridium sp. SHJSY1 TaxID=2942483 RepID=UPI002876B5DA|nr:hypothetical protein [Clostridium sp. SHJSY1]MDS0528349.1 hypothetical protein [Clostridium sp. SHJSY1]
MDIYKALKREKKLHKMFYITMTSIAIILPLAVFLTGLNTFIYISYLLVIEFLIGITVLRKTNITKLSYLCNNNRLKIKGGLFGKESLIFCDKVVLVHTEKMDQEMEIIIITSVNFKNRALKPVMKSFLKRYPVIRKEYSRIEEKNENSHFYFQVIRRGELNKYMLLDVIYKNCVKAVYTEESIQNIKIARGQTLA